MARDTLSQIFINAVTAHPGHSNQRVHGRKGGALQGGRPDGDGRFAISHSPSQGRERGKVTIKKSEGTHITDKSMKPGGVKPIPGESAHPAAVAVRGREGWREQAALKTSGGYKIPGEVHFESPGGSLGGMQLHDDGRATAWVDTFTRAGNPTDVTKSFSAKNSAKAIDWVEMRAAQGDNYN